MSRRDWYERVNAAWPSGPLPALTARCGSCRRKEFRDSLLTLVDTADSVSHTERDIRDRHSELEPKTMTASVSSAFTPTLNPMISKVQKLLRTASDSGATPEEAATAFAVAQRLMMTHRITQAEIEAHARGEAKAAGRVDPADMQTAVLGPRSGRQDGWLAMSVGEVCGVGVYHSHASNFGVPSAAKVLVGYGLPADLAVAKELYTWVREHMTKARTAWCAERGVRRTSVEGNSFADGFSLAVLAKARAERTEREKSTETVAAADEHGKVLALVVIGVAQQELQRALTVKAKQLGLGKGRPRSVNTDWSARSQGQAAGGAVNLSRRVVR